MTAKQLAEKLKQAGLIVLSTSEPSFEEDGAIQLEHDITVQVGYNYTLLNMYQYENGQLVSVTHVKDNPSINFIVEFVKGA